MSRDPDSFVLEVDYWRGVIDELRSLDELIAATARPLATEIVGAIQLAMICQTDADRAALEGITRGIRRALEGLREMQAHTSAIGELLDGRLIVLTREREELEGGSV